jgi:hypothetical protein
MAATMKRIVFAVLLLVSARGVFACSCVRGGSVAENALGSDAVFAGVVESIEDTGPPRELKVTFRVLQWWKGEEFSESVVVMTGRDGAACGYPVVKGQSFLVFASHTPEKRLSLSLCSMSSALVCAMDDLKALGPPVKTYETIKRKALIAREQPYPAYTRPCLRAPLLIGERGLEMDRSCVYPVEGVIGRDGVVRDFRIVRQPAQNFCPAGAYIAERVAAWRFRPAKINGAAVETRLAWIAMHDPITETEWKKEQENH